MIMSNFEILRDFHEAKDKHKQIGILADLNVTTRAAIVDLLRDSGVDDRAISRRRKKEKKPC